jgi:pimeloyl-ACP methyl ester carboxylesterase
MTLDEWQQAGRYFEHNGHRLFYREHGRGAKALVLIHGFPTASWDWAALWPALCEKFSHVVALDMLGFGFSTKPDQHRYSLIEQADLHAALLARLGVDRVHILAHDYGVSVAQELLARQIEGRDPSLLSVTLLNGGLFPETHRPTAMQKLLLSPLGPVAARLGNEAGFNSSFSTVFGPNTQPKPEELKDFWRLIKHNRGHRQMHRLIRYIEERREHRERWVGALQKAAVPIRLINGPEDPVSGAHMVARYRELVPNPDVVSLPGIGHYPQVEAPQQVLQAFLEFHARLR